MYCAAACGGNGVLHDRSGVHCKGCSITHEHKRTASAFVFTVKDGIRGFASLGISDYKRRVLSRDLKKASRFKGTRDGCARSVNNVGARRDPDGR